MQWARELTRPSFMLPFYSIKRFLLNMYNRYKVVIYTFVLRCPIRAGGQGPGDGLEEENQNVDFRRLARCCPMIGCIIF